VEGFKERIQEEVGNWPAKHGKLLRRYITMRTGKREKPQEKSLMKSGGVHTKLEK